MVERLTRRERQDMYVLLGFVGLLLTAVATALILRDNLLPTQWDGLAAIAASVQAIGVLAALFYAARQIQVSRSEAEARRRDELLDRLEATVFDDLSEAVEDLMSEWSLCRVEVALVRRYFDEGGTAQDPRMTDHRKTDAERATALLRRERVTAHLLLRVGRLLAWLGAPDTGFQQCRRVLLRFSWTELPDIEDPDKVRTWLHEAATPSEGFTSFDKFADEMTALILSHTAARRAEPGP